MVDEQEEDDESNQGKVYDYEARVPIFALSFSNRSFTTALSAEVIKQQMEAASGMKHDDEVVQ